MTTLNTQWSRAVTPGTPIVLCGAGNICRQFLDQYPDMLAQEGELSINTVCDNDKGKQGLFAWRYDGVSPKHATQCHGSAAVYLIFIHNGAEDMRKQLEGYGVPPDRILHWWAAWMHFDALRVPEWEDVPTPPADWLDVWSDHQSKQVAQDALAFYKRYSDRTADYKPITNFSTPENIYFDETIYKPLEDERFLDCGAFDGDTMMEFRKRYDMYKADICCVEASRENYRALENKMTRLLPEGDSKWCALVGDPSLETVRFSGSGVNARIGDEGDEVPAFTIDHICKHWVTSLIKMDIEGAEIDALRGAVATIKRDRPVLVICLYHKPADMWEIPAFLASVCEDYRFYMRNYDGLFETVLYAVPNERSV